MEIEELPKVIQNSDYLFKSDIKWIEPTEPKEINEYEKNMLKNTKTPEQLLEEEKNEIKPEYTEEQKTELERRNYIMKVKVISLDEMNKHPLSNPSNFSSRDKKELIKIMEKNLDIETDELTKKFNQVCLDKLFDEKSDYSTYPVYSKLV